MGLNCCNLVPMEVSDTKVCQPFKLAVFFAMCSTRLWNNSIVVGVVLLSGIRVFLWFYGPGLSDAPYLRIYIYMCVRVCL